MKVYDYSLPDNELWKIATALPIGEMPWDYFCECFGINGDNGYKRMLIRSMVVNKINLIAEKKNASFIFKNNKTKGISKIKGHSLAVDVISKNIKRVNRAMTRSVNKLESIQMRPAIPEGDKKIAGKIMKMIDGANYLLQNKIATDKKMLNFLNETDVVQKLPVTKLLTEGTI